MPSTILGLGTALPQHQMSQDQAVQMFTDIVCQEERQKRLGRALFRKSGVQQRHTVVPHRVAYNWCQAVSESSSQPATSNDRAVPSDLTPTVQAGQSRGPTTAERMELYARFAADLAVASSAAALEQAAIAPQQITHLIVVTCTGFDAPGVDIELMERLGLPATTQRLQIGFMGCHGAINGLRAAHALTQADAAARVLLCAVELCSLHYRFTWDSEGIIGNALFADGSAALVLGPHAAPSSSLLPPGRESSGLPAQWSVCDTGSVLIADSKSAMSWSIGDNGFDMRLTSEVGEKIETQLADWLSGWLGRQHLQLQDIDYWGVHPGGPKIVNAVQRSLQLDEQALGTTRAILQRHGNMSSPTVLFILNEFRKQHGQRGKPAICLLLGFGPGLVAEAALLRID